MYLELLDLYDETRMKTGKTIARGEKVPDGYFRMVIHVCIIHEGRMLIQQRSPEKHSWAGLWDFSAGGGVISGELSKEAAVREVKEELGITFPPESLRPALSVNFGYGFDDIYIVNKNVSLSSLKLRTEEVASVRWAGKREILRMIDDGVFIPYQKDFVGFLFFLEKHTGVHTVYGGDKNKFK